jgi:hypothetical protein
VLWLEALAVARAAGRSVVDDVLRFAKHFMPDAEVRDVNSSLANLDAQWELEIFAEQYTALRRTRPPGADRTRRMTTLMLSPRRLAKTRKWTKREVVEAWASGDDGKRLFVLGLMSADARLVLPEILIEGVRASRSAFEQYEALNAIFSNSPLPAKQAKLIHEVIRAERTGIPRPDGAPARIDQGTDRWELAEVIVPQRKAPKRT